MYGCMPLADILPEVRNGGASHIDIWPRVHGNQREQIEQMGEETFAALLKKHKVKLGIVTRYDLGPFRLQEEMQFARRFGASLVICGGKGPRNCTGSELKAAVAHFAEQMKPHIEAAEKLGVTIGIENHGNNLIESPDSMRYLADFTRSKHIGIALAPYHLPQDPKRIAKLIRDLGGSLVHFYAWQHGKGCHKKLPDEQMLLQLPGRGTLDFAPILEALRSIKYKGFTEIFMHPVPRGVPILPEATQVTGEINRARRHLEALLEKRKTAEKAQDA